MWRKPFLIPLLALLFLGCEVNTTVTVDNGYPPTFTLHGSGGIYLLRVYDMTDPQSMNGKWWERPGIWEIAPQNTSGYISDLPPIKYGTVPSGFVQQTPQEGQAPILVEGKIYWVWTPTYGANGGGSNKFIVRDGQTIELSD